MPTPEALFDSHRARLEAAVAATASRGYFSAYPESPSPRVYGENAAADGLAAFRSWSGSDFPVLTPGAAGSVGGERSPFGPDLGVRYPRVRPEGIDELLAAARAAMPAWRDAGPRGRVGVCLEVLARLHARVFELANAVMHTSGQAFVMAFQAGGTHALDRALEALAYAWAGMTRHPERVVWEKPGRGEPERVEKTFTPVGRGVGLVIGCNTFPTWNSWPGLFASLATGNAVVVKPHPSAVLPLAITVQAAQQVLTEAGLDPALVTLAAEDPADRLAAVLAVRPEVALVDFTGSTTFGSWLESNATQAQVFTEKAGVNTVVIDSTDDFAGMCANLAQSLSLYTGQMCTTPQNILLPAQGIPTDEGHKTPAEVVAGIRSGMDRLLGEDARAVELLGAVVSDAVLSRLEASAAGGDVLVASRPVTHPSFPQARVRTPTLVAVDVADEATYARECFGPVSYLVRTGSTSESLECLARTVAEHGAMTAAVYSTDPQVLREAERIALQVGVSLSENLTGGTYVNQSAAFSDFHGSGANPAANASFTDDAFVASRFRIIEVRRRLPASTG